MRRPGNLNGVETLKPKHRYLGMMPPSMGPNIPGPPKPHPGSPQPFPGGMEPTIASFRTYRWQVNKTRCCG